MHSWFFLYDEKVAQRMEEKERDIPLSSKDLCSSSSVPNLEFEQSKYFKYLINFPVCIERSSFLYNSDSVIRIPRELNFIFPQLIYKDYTTVIIIYVDT